MWSLTGSRYIGGLFYRPAGQSGDGEGGGGSQRGGGTPASFKANSQGNREYYC